MLSKPYNEHVHTELSSFGACVCTCSIIFFVPGTCTASANTIVLFGRCLECKQTNHCTLILHFASQVSIVGEGLEAKHLPVLQDHLLN